MTNKFGPRLFAWMQLFRLPNLFTAIADVSMGFLFVHAGLHTPTAPWTVFAMLLISSCLLYTAGMVLNDVFDYEQDRELRPERPLPSGRIPLDSAQRAGAALLIAGILHGWMAGLAASELAVYPWRSGVVATALALCIVAYDSQLKHTWAGPLAMGGCRFLNVLLGMSFAGEIPGASPNWLGFHPAQLIVAAGIGMYIVGVTWFARTEAVVSNRAALLGGTLLMMGGYLLLALFPKFETPGLPWGNPPEQTWWMVMAILGIPLWRRCLLAISHPAPQPVQNAVRFGILSLTVLDASVCLAARGPVPAVCIALLLIPSLILARYIPST